MPYIQMSQRIELSPIVEQIKTIPIVNAGELNYMFTMLARSYLKAHGVSYQRINDIVGALEGAKLELYRRVAADYENEKILENGDVYETE